MHKSKSPQISYFTFNPQTYNFDYQQLKTAVKGLLSELRIDGYCLKTMADGYSPDSLEAEFPNMDSKPKIQLSKVVAEKLLQALGILNVKYTSNISKDSEEADNVDNIEYIEELKSKLKEANERLGKIKGLTQYK